MRTLTRGRKRWLLLAVPAFCLTGALVAWALLQLDTSVTGSVTGEDASAAITLSNVTADSGNSGSCTWSKTADSKGLTLNVAKAARGVTTTCRATATYANTGNVDLQTQAFSVTSSIGTSASGFNANAGPGERCGAIAPGGGTGGVRVVVQIGAVPVGGSGTLTGKLTHVDTASYSAGACSPVL